ncbi:MAG: peptidyl-prolyl cis-trans isomerase C [Syntrophaceae bacterium]|nr:MAG: peptidyl-prolyl cis-trans isomerase C [Syntrophaceae bacterium]
MNKIAIKSVLTVLCVILIAVMFGCGKKEEATKESPQQTQQNAQTASPLVLDKAVVAPTIKDSPQVEPKDVAVSVDDLVLKKDELAKRVAAKMSLYKDKIPADKKKEAQDGLKKQLVEEFVLRTILNKEANNKKIVATDKEIQAATNQIKDNIPPDKKVEDFFKENNITREDIILGIKIRKLVDMESGKKNKPTQKEISKFFTDNQEKFTTQESVHVRHILVMIDAKDDEKTKTEKKAKAENLRKQVSEGADFAEIAKNNSDCPSKENGGDLGEIKKGQTVKPFEDAAFSQEKNAIGPVVTTEFGHHIIQVLGRSPAKIIQLDEVKDKIGVYLEQQKQGEVFAQMTARLKKNAVIVYYEK